MDITQAHAIVWEWHDNDEELRIPDNAFGTQLFDALAILLAFAEGRVITIPSTPPTSSRTNVDDALGIVAEIDQVRAVLRELKAAFARSELDGGVKAAPRHPLYTQCEERLATLHDQLMLLI